MPQSKAAFVFIAFVHKSFMQIMQLVYIPQINTKKHPTRLSHHIATHPALRHVFNSFVFQGPTLSSIYFELPSGTCRQAAAAGQRRVTKSFVTCLGSIQTEGERKAYFFLLTCLNQYVEEDMLRKHSGIDLSVYWYCDFYVRFA